MSDVAAFINESERGDATLSRIAVPRAAARCRTDGRRSRAQRAAAAPNPSLFQDYFDSRAKTLGFSAAALMKNDGNGRRDRRRFGRRSSIAKPDASDFDDATNERSASAACSATATSLSASARPGRSTDNFLYAARSIDPLAAKVARRRRQRLRHFSRFEAHRHNLELGFATVFVAARA